MLCVGLIKARITRVIRYAIDLGSRGSGQSAFFHRYHHTLSPSPTLPLPLFFACTSLPFARPTLPTFSLRHDLSIPLSTAFASSVSRPSTRIRLDSTTTSSFSPSSFCYFLRVCPLNLYCEFCVSLFISSIVFFSLFCSPLHDFANDQLLLSQSVPLCPLLPDSRLVPWVVVACICWVSVLM